MAAVITTEQARQITGGRTPLVPLEYEAACKSLQACVTLEESKYWSDKADALAAWAKIYRDDTVERQAKILKLRAYRRMGELAKELRPHKCVVADSSHGNGKTMIHDGPHRALREAGLTKSQANAAITLGRLPTPTMAEIESRQRPPSPTTVSMSWAGRDERHQLRSDLNALASRCRSVSPGEFKRWVTTSKAGGSSWRDNAEEVHDWLNILLKGTGASQGEGANPGG